MVYHTCMEEKEIKHNFSQNLIRLRKQFGLTQLQLAQKLNYSDKTISKWECGETLPDIVVFSTIAEFFKISVSKLIEKPKEDSINLSKKTRLLIIVLSCGLVWLIAGLVFFAFLVFPVVESDWLAFVFAIPCTFIVLVVFSSLWYKELFQCISTSGLIWTIALSLSLCFASYSLWFIYVIAGILQVLFALWYLLRYIHLRKEKNL